MSASVLEKNGIKCNKTYPAKISNYHLEIKPKVNLVKKEHSISYGGLALVKSKQLKNLYEYVNKTYGQEYFPYPVLAEKNNGKTQLALCYMAKPYDFGFPEKSYIKEMVECAKEMEAPNSYIKHIKSFKNRT